MPLVPSTVELSVEERLLLDATSEFARDELLALDRLWDRDESSVAPELARIGEMGLFALCVPEEFGGLNCTYRVYAAILHELARWSPSVCVTVAVHNMVLKLLRSQSLSPAAAKFLSEMGHAANLGAFAISEAGAGSDARAIVTNAVPVDGGFLVSGEKMWITNGMSARWFVTLARVKGLTGEKAYCALLIDGESPGIQRTKIIGKMGIRGSETAVIHLMDVFVPNDRLLGELGMGLKVFLSTLSAGRVGIAAQATGIAEACLEEMVTYARQREQFGQPIGKFQAVGGMIADSAMELEAAKALVWYAAENVESGHLSRRVCSQAKLYASEAANRIAYRAVQVHGGAGYVQECRVEQLFRDARVTTIYEGTSEVQRTVIAKELSPTGKVHAH